MVKTILKSVREFKKSSALTIFFVTCEVIMECLIPFAVAKLVNTIKAGTQLSQVGLYALLLVALSVVSLIFGVLAARNSAKSATGFAKNLRSDLFAQIQRFSFSNIDKFSTSSLVTRLTTDVNYIQQSYMMMLRAAIRSPLMLIFSFTMAYLIAGQLAFVYLAVAPLLALGIVIIVKIVLPIFKKVLKSVDAFNNSIQENIKGMRVVKAYVREDFEVQKFTQAANAILSNSLKGERYLALLNPLMQFCLYMVMIVVLTFGSFLIIDSKGSLLDVGQFVAMFVYSWQILMSLMMFGMIFAMLTMSLESARRVVEILNEESTIQNTKHPVLQVKDGSIQFENVYFSYYQDIDKCVLKAINLSIQSGETIGIIGSTGSSKTSLVNLISRLYDVTKGSVKIAGVDVREIDLVTLRDEVAVVLQKNVLFSGTIKDNLRWGNPDASDEEMIKACQLAAAHDFIMSFEKGYDTEVKQGGANLSGGQKQRLCIARAILKRPKILILDDSTSAVDTATDAKIKQGLRVMLPEMTKLIIAQRINSVIDADRIVVLEQGEISDIGTHQQLLETSAIYRQVYESQTIGGDFDEI